MITAWLISIGSLLAVWVAGLFPTWSPPAELVHVDDQINGIFDMGEGLAPWADWPYVAVIAAIPLAVWTAGLTIKAVRVLVSHLPWIGGRG